MPRQSISLTDKNTKWSLLLVDDHIRQVTEAGAINNKLENAEKPGFTTQSPAEILSEIKSGIRR